MSSTSRYNSHQREVEKSTPRCSLFFLSNHKTSSLFPSEGAHITSRALLHANTQTEQKMDALLARAHVLAEKCKDSSVVWSDVCDGLHGEGARLIISFFLFVLSPPSVKITARARTRARLPLRTHLLPFSLRVCAKTPNLSRQISPRKNPPRFSSNLSFKR